MITDQKIQEVTLLMLAREIVKQLSYINYPDEWSRKPLASIWPHLVSVLDIHPMKVGQIVDDAYRKTVPSKNAGNINQLDRLQPALFAKDRQYFIDAYEVQSFMRTTNTTGRDLHDSTSNSLDASKRKIANLVSAELQAFDKLSPEQENEHRTLETICFATAPVCHAFGLAGIGFDISEYADQWRTLDAAERNKLLSSIRSLNKYD